MWQMNTLCAAFHNLAHEAYGTEPCHLPYGGVLCHPMSPEISHFRKHGIEDIQDGTSMQFYFSTEGLVGND